MQKTFNYVFSTEAFAHFFHPGGEIRKIRALLREKALLIVMTQRWRGLAHFSKWHYARDATHVSFYQARTFDFLCRAFGFSRIFDDDDRVVILRKGRQAVDELTPDQIQELTGLLKGLRAELTDALKSTRTIR